MAAFCSAKTISGSMHFSSSLEFATFVKEGEGEKEESGKNKWKERQRKSECDQIEITNYANSQKINDESSEFIQQSICISLSYFLPSITSNWLVGFVELFSTKNS